MKNMEEINARYQELCTILGDVSVKKKGLENHEKQLFEELNKLDEQARKLCHTPVAEESKDE